MTIRKEEQQEKNNSHMEKVIGALLQNGVIICFVIIGAGLFIMLFGSESQISQTSLREILKGEELSEFKNPKSVEDFFQGIFAGRADVIIASGLLLLISLPILRVFVSSVLFAFQKSWVFCIITLSVFLILLSGLILGQNH